MKPPFSITNKILNLTIEITKAITRLEIEQERNLHLQKENRMRSIHSSLAIEKNSLSLEQVTDIIDGKRVLGAPKEIKEVQNAYEAYEVVFGMNPYNVSDFLLAHALMTNDLVIESGRFRNGDVGVYDSFGNVVHMGARPQYIHNLIEELFQWAKDDDVPDLVKSCVVHFEIEMIHPFADGNGRMGRMWQSLILSKWQRVFEWIPIETIVYENQSRYYEVIEICDRENDSTEFIEFMLEIILETISQYGKEEISDKVHVFLGEKVIDKLNNKELEFSGKIYSYLEEYGEISNSKASILAERPQGTSRRYLLKLVDLGALKIKGENKNRRYVLK